jgi:hypothetical protein
MPRPPAAPPRSQFSDEEAELYDAAIARSQALRSQVHGGPGETDEPIPPYPAALLNSPIFAGALWGCSKAIRTAGERDNTYTHAQREWVDQVLSLALDNPGMAYRHTPDGLAVGIRLEAIEALWDGREEDLSAEEALLTRYIRQLITGTVDDATYNEIEELMGTRGVVEYTILIGYLMMVTRLQQAFGHVEFSREEIHELLDDFREGRRELPDFRERIK